MLEGHGHQHEYLNDTHVEHTHWGPDAIQLLSRLHGLVSDQIGWVTSVRGRACQKGGLLVRMFKRGLLIPRQDLIRHQVDLRTTRFIGNWQNLDDHTAGKSIAANEDNQTVGSGPTWRLESRGAHSLTARMASEATRLMPRPLTLFSSHCVSVKHELVQWLL